MNRLWIALLALGLNGAASADTVGLKLSAGRWNADIDGDIRKGGESVDLQSDLGLDDESNDLLALTLEHPVPFLPNLRIQRTELETAGDNVVDRSFVYDDEVYTVNTRVVTGLDLSHNEAIFYYSPLDNWAHADVGLSVKHFDGDVNIRNETESSQTDLDDYIPALYGKLAFELPLTGLSLHTEASGISYSGNRLLDVQASVAYEYEVVYGEVGYRRFDLELDDIDDLDGDILFDGMFVNVGLHF